MHSDTPTKGIVKGLREGGAACYYWQAVSRTKGAADLIVGWGGVTFLMEVKSEKGKLSSEQEKFHAAWQKVGGPICVVRTLAEAKAAIGMI